SARSSRTELLYGILAEEMPKRKTAEWLDAFERLDVPHSRVNDLDDLLNDPHLEAAGFFRPTEQGGAGIRSIAQPIVFDDAPCSPDMPAPALGADSEAILKSLGYGADEIARLRATGVLKP